MQTNTLIIGCNGFVVSIDPLNGNEIWRTKLREGVLGGSRGYDVSVLLKEDKVFAGCYGRIYCLARIDGRLLWSNELNGIGYNEVALATEGVSTQFITRVEHTTGT